MLEFGISGLLYKSNVLLYDRQTESLWSQLAREAVTGLLTGSRLKTVRSSNTTWKRWKKRHPDTLVMDIDTGYRRDYTNDPYESYRRSPLAFLGLGSGGKRLDDKDLVLGVETTDGVRAYPFKALRNTPSPVTDLIGNRRIEVHHDTESGDAHATDETGAMVESIVTYWFVWESFHPDTDIYGGSQDKE